eukprot:602607-Prymnesium_polylepis.1
MPATHCRSMVAFHAQSGSLDRAASLRDIRCRMAMSGIATPTEGAPPPAAAAAVVIATDVAMPTPMTAAMGYE